MSRSEPENAPPARSRTRRAITFIGTMGLAAGLWTGAMTHDMHIYPTFASQDAKEALAFRQHEPAIRQRVVDALTHHFIAEKVPEHAEFIHAQVDAFEKKTYGQSMRNALTPSSRLSNASTATQGEQLVAALNAEEAKHPHYAPYRHQAELAAEKFIDAKRRGVDLTPPVNGPAPPDWETTSTGVHAATFGTFDTLQRKGIDTRWHDFGIGFGIGAAGGMAAAGAYWALMSWRLRKYKIKAKQAEAQGNEPPRTHWFFDWFGFNREFRE